MIIETSAVEEVLQIEYVGAPTVVQECILRIKEQIEYLSRPSEDVSDLVEIYK